MKSIRALALAASVLASSAPTLGGHVLGATPAAWRHAMGRPSPWQKGDSMG
jgi:hypothetical protein